MVDSHSPRTPASHLQKAGNINAQAVGLVFSTQLMFVGTATTALMVTQLHTTNGMVGNGHQLRAEKEPT